MCWVLVSRGPHRIHRTPREGPKKCSCDHFCLWRVSGAVDPQLGGKESEYCKRHGFPKDVCFLNLKLVTLCKSKFCRLMITDDFVGVYNSKMEQENERRSSEDRSKGWDAVAEN